MVILSIKNILIKLFLSLEGEKMFKYDAKLFFEAETLVNEANKKLTET